MAVLDIVETQEEKTAINTNREYVHKVKPCNVVHSALKICLKMLYAFANVICFLYGAVTRNTRPVVHIKRSKDNSLYISINTDRTNENYISNNIKEHGLEKPQAITDATFSRHHVVYNNDDSRQINNTSYINTNGAKEIKEKNSTESRELTQDSTTFQHHTGQEGTESKKVLLDTVDDVPDVTASHAQCARGDDINGKQHADLKIYDLIGNNSGDEKENKCEIPEDESVSNTLCLKSTQREERSGIDNTRQPTPTYGDIQNNTLNIIVFERKKIKTNRIKRDTKRDTWKERGNYLYSESGIRQYTEDFFSSKQSRGRPHVLWPSMHPLIPYKERFLDENGSN